MKKQTIKLTLAIFIFLIGTANAKAQFEQKLTLQTSAGFVAAFAPESFVNIFDTGLSVDAGVQYNFNRTFSMVAMAKYAMFFFIPEDEFSLETAKFNQLGFSLCPKVRFFPLSKVNPYIFGGLSLNYINIEFSIDGNETRTAKSPTNFGAISGLGVDFRLNDNIAIFYQGGVNWIDMDVVIINSFYQQLGVNINMFKAKTL